MAKEEKSNKEDPVFQEIMLTLRTEGYSMSSNEVNKLRADIDKLKESDKSLSQNTKKLKDTTREATKAHIDQERTINDVQKGIEKTNANVKKMNSLFKKVGKGGVRVLGDALKGAVPFAAVEGWAEYRKTLYKVGGSAKMVGKSHEQLEKMLSRLRNQQNLTKEGGAELFDLYSKGMPITSVEGFNRVMSKLGKTTRGNVELMKEFTGVITSLSQKLPGLQQELEATGNNISDVIARSSRSLYLVGEIGQEEYKNAQRLAALQSGSATQKEKDLQKNLDTMTEFKEQAEIVRNSLARALMPITEDLAEWLENNQETVKNLFETFARTMGIVAKLGGGLLKALSPVLKVLDVISSKLMDLIKNHPILSSIAGGAIVFKMAKRAFSQPGSSPANPMFVMDVTSMGRGAMKGMGKIFGKLKNTRLFGKASGLVTRGKGLAGRGLKGGGRLIGRGLIGGGKLIGKGAGLAGRGLIGGGKLMGKGAGLGWKGLKAGRGLIGKIAGKGALKMGGKGLGKSLLKKIPLAGILAGGAFATSRLMKGDALGALGEAASGLASILPGLGTAASVAIDAGLAARDIAKSGEEEQISPFEQRIKDIGSGKVDVTGKSQKPIGDFSKELNQLNPQIAKYEKIIEQKKKQYKKKHGVGWDEQLKQFKAEKERLKNAKASVETDEEKEKIAEQIKMVNDEITSVQEERNKLVGEESKELRKHVTRRDEVFNITKKQLETSRQLASTTSGMIGSEMEWMKMSGNINPEKIRLETNKNIARMKENINTQTKLRLEYERQIAVLEKEGRGDSQEANKLREQSVASTKEIAETNRGIVTANENLVKIYGQKLEIASLEVQQMSTLISLAESYAIGVGASVNMRVKQFGQMTKEIGALKQQREEIEKNIAAGQDVEYWEKRRLELNNKILEKQKSQAETVKALRDGWIKAISAMNTGAGTFSKIIMDQNKNTGAMMQMLGDNAIVSSFSGSTKGGYGRSERFTATGGIKGQHMNKAYDALGDEMLGAGGFQQFQHSQREQLMQSMGKDISAKAKKTYRGGALAFGSERQKSAFVGAGGMTTTAAGSGGIPSPTATPTASPQIPMSVNARYDLSNIKIQVNIKDMSKATETITRKLESALEDVALEVVERATQ